MTDLPNDKPQAGRQPQGDLRQREYRAVTLLLVFGCLTLALDTALDYGVPIPGQSSTRLADHSVYYQTLVLHVVVVISFLAYGLYISKILRDVREAEKDLIESEDRYRQLTQHSLTGIYILQEGIFVYVNDRFCDITGYPAHELLANPAWRFFHPDDLQMVLDRVASCFLGHTMSPQYQTRLRCRDSSEKWVEVLATTIVYKGRNAEMGNVADITGRKRAEQDRERLVEDLTAARERLQFEATHDGLTGLLNRKAILERLSMEIARSRREGAPLAVIMADLDHFKSVNDSHGHLAGDAVLAETARRILASVRPYDLVGRYGGEEVLIVLPGCDESAAFARAQTIRESPVQTNHHSVRISMSFGVAAIPANDEQTDLDSIINAADSAMYRAKGLGRNCVSGQPTTMGKRV